MRQVLPIVAAVLTTVVLAGCTGASGEQTDDFIATRDQHVNAAAAVMELFPDAQWSAKQRVVWCERPDGPFNVPPRTRIFFSMHTPNLEGTLVGVDQDPVSPEQLAEVFPQILDIFAQAGWDAEDYSDETHGSLQIGGNVSETYQTSFFVTATADGVEINGRTPCLVGDRGALADAIRDAPTPWNEDVFTNPVYDDEWVVD